MTFASHSPRAPAGLRRCKITLLHLTAGNLPYFLFLPLPLCHSQLLKCGIRSRSGARRAGGPDGRRANTDGIQVSGRRGRWMPDGARMRAPVGIPTRIPTRMRTRAPLSPLCPRRELGPVRPAEAGPGGRHPRRPPGLAQWRTRDPAAVGLGNGLGLLGTRTEAGAAGERPSGLVASESDRSPARPPKARPPNGPETSRLRPGSDCCYWGATRARPRGSRPGKPESRTGPADLPQWPYLGGGLGPSGPALRPAGG